MKDSSKNVHIYQILDAGVSGESVQLEKLNKYTVQFEEKWEKRWLVSVRFENKINMRDAKKTIPIVQKAFSLVY